MTGTRNSASWRAKLTPAEKRELAGLDKIIDEARRASETDAIQLARSRRNKIVNRAIKRAGR